MVLFRIHGLHTLNIAIAGMSDSAPGRCQIEKSGAERAGFAGDVSRQMVSFGRSDVSDRYGFSDTRRFLGTSAYLVS